LDSSLWQREGRRDFSGDNSPALRRNSRSAWFIPFLIFAVCAMPFLAGWALYVSGWRPAAVKANGELLRDTPLGQASGHWQLIYYAPRECDSRCTATLIGLRNAHAAQGKERQRVERLVLAPDAAAARHYQVLFRREAGVTVRVGAGEGILLADPAGRAVLRYGADASPDGIRRDLSKLMRYSWIG
jgi:hypothetical protein